MVREINFSRSALSLRLHPAGGGTPMRPNPFITAVNITTKTPRFRDFPRRPNGGGHVSAIHKPFV